MIIFYLPRLIVSRPEVAVSLCVSKRTYTCREHRYIIPLTFSRETCCHALGDTHNESYVCSSVAVFMCMNLPLDVILLYSSQY